MTAAQLLTSDDHWSVDLGGIHVIFGDGTLDRLGSAATELLVGREPRALLVTDPGIEDAGHARRAENALRAAGIDVFTFDGVRENPTTEHVDQGVAAARKHDVQVLIGLGGGSAMDCCKGINFLYTNGGRMEDYWGMDKATQPMLPSIGIPTTAGTGSEAQRFALISQAESHAKMACGDRKARFRTVILDPELISSMPREVAAVTGMDALSHALESYVTARRNPISQLFAREAWRLLEGSFESFLTDPKDKKGRSRMLLGAHLAGAAIETSMLGAAHSCANPLTAHFAVTHGAAVGLMLPHVIRFNSAAVPELYGELASVAGITNGNGGSGAVSDGASASSIAVEGLGSRVREMLLTAGLPLRLADWQVDHNQLHSMAQEAAKQWTAQFNPRPAGEQDMHDLYEAAY